MTHKTEMVSVPRELLERLLEVYSPSPWPAWHELAAGLEANPAEDVRAVVDEPVAWIRTAAKKWFYESFDDDLLEKMETHKIIAQAEGFSVSVMAELQLEMEKAYRSHPQRPAVLPERKPTGTELTMRRLYVNIGFNACLDRIAEKNK